MSEVFNLFDAYPVIPGGLVAFLLLLAFIRRGKKRRDGNLSRAGRRNGGGFLDRVILDLGGIPFTGKMATEGMFTCAELGWGKTFLVFRKVLKACLRAGMGGYILGAKAEDLETVRRLFRELGIADKLVVVGPRHQHRINCFGALASIAPPDSIEEEIIGFFTSLLESEGRSASTSSGDDTKFFTAHGQRLLGAILICLRLAGEPITAANIYRFLVALPQTAAAINTAAWQEGYANQCLAKAFNAAKSSRDSADYENAHRYLLGELANLNDRTRSSIVSTVSSMLSKLLRGWMAEIWSTTSTVRFQDAFEGKWLYFDTSPLEYGEYGVASLVMAKHLAQRCVMRRRIQANSRPVAIMGDEWQAIFVTADRDYQAVCRSQLGCTWAATQNLTGLYAVLSGGPAAEVQAQSWVALLGTKVFVANTDWKTNTYASELCGAQLETLMSGNINHADEMKAYDALMGKFNASTGWNQSYQPQVRPEHFVRLAKPEPPRHEAEAIVVTPRLLQMMGSHWAQITLRPE